MFNVRMRTIKMIELREYERNYQGPYRWCSICSCHRLYCETSWEGDGARTIALRRIHVGASGQLTGSIRVVSQFEI
jgi:hypothetical protein